jgi:hypothetical protein
MVFNLDFERSEIGCAARTAIRPQFVQDRQAGIQIASSGSLSV